MAFVTKTWKDRLVEFAGRRKLKNVSTNEEILYDVSRSEGAVIQAGDAFSASNMNDLEQRIKTEFDNVSNSLIADNAQKFQFAYDSESQKYGFKAKVEGADTFFPFNDMDLDGMTFTVYFVSSGAWGGGSGMGQITFPKAMDGYYLLPIEVSITQGNSYPSASVTYSLSGGSGGSGSVVLNRKFSLGNNKSVTINMQCGGSGTQGVYGIGRVTLKLTKEN